MERLEEHAEPRGRAARHAEGGQGQYAAGRLVDNEAVLLHAYRTIAKAISEERAITPAAEWLVDNYHIVERQIRDIRSHLPPGYYRQLPKLAEGPFAGYPRVLGVAWAFVAHTDRAANWDAIAIDGRGRAWRTGRPGDLLGRCRYDPQQSQTSGREEQPKGLVHCHLHTHFEGSSILPQVYAHPLVTGDT